jgi:hypothetical protein
LARAKNTQRANARRRYREQVRVNELSDDVNPNEFDDGNDEDSTEPVSGSSSSGGIGSLFSRPNVREDIRALPGMFRTKRLLWLPFAILLGAFLVVGGLQAGLVPLGVGGALGIAYALVLQPSALFVPFIGGFLAPRGSYLIGAMIGFTQAVFVSLLLVLRSVRESKLESLPSQWTSGTTPATDLTSSDVVSSIVSVFVVCLLFGTVAAAFASWYRNFLRNSQQRAQANRIVREKAAREKAKEREREQRIAERDARKTAPRKAAP